MTVVSFKNKELDSLAFDVENQEEFKEIASRLGMPAQESFITDSKSDMPYPFINQSMDNVFTTLCPRKVDHKKYSKTPIPLEVMRELSFVVGEGYFSEIEVWYDDKSPDPFLVGIRKRYQAYYYPNGKESGNSKNTGYEFETKQQAEEWVSVQGYELYFVSSETNKYLIARWGDEIREIAELKTMAIERLVEKYTNSWLVQISNLQAKLKATKENILLFLNGEITESQLQSPDR